MLPASGNATLVAARSLDLAGGSVVSWINVKFSSKLSELLEAFIVTAPDASCH